MKKILLLLLWVAPMLSYAQNEPFLLKDFREDVKAFSPFIWDDHLNIVQVYSGNDNSEIMAMDDKMNVVWSVLVKGQSLKCLKFKNKVLVLTSKVNKNTQLITGDISGYLIDPKTGKIVLEKVIYTSKSVYYEDFSFLHNIGGNSSFFKLAVRETNLKKSTIGSFTANKDLNTTQNIAVIDFSEALVATSTLKPVFADGIVFSINSNNAGDVFVSTFNNSKTVEITRYPANSGTASAKLGQDIDVRGSMGTNSPGDYIKVFPSNTDYGVAYFSVVHENSDKDIQLAVGKIDLEKKTKNLVVELFDKSHKKQIEKSFVKLSKDINKPEIGYSGDLDVRYMYEHNGILLVALSNRHLQRGMYGSWAVEQAMVINGYDPSLKMKFQQVLPVEHGNTIGYINTAFYAEGNNLHVVTNQSAGMASIEGVYGKLNLADGKWSAMQVLSKKKLKNAAYAGNVMWFKNNYVVPYMSVHGVFGIKYDVHLQQNFL